MQKFTSVSEMDAYAAALRGNGARVALIPTRGALHAGHGAMIESARMAGYAAVVSIFVNPLQFGMGEGFASYPRMPADDEAFCEKAGVDALFVPSSDDLLPRGYSTFVLEETLSKPLDGVSRPSHFRGVTTATAKLLNIVRPHRLILGRKDAQQVAVIRKMVGDLHFGVEIVATPIVREPDGLACSARNRELTTSQRQEALVLFHALEKVRQMVAAGTRSADRLVAEATHIISQRRRVRIIYIALVDSNTMEVLREVAPGHSLLAVAVWVDETRLTDNLDL